MVRKGRKERQRRLGILREMDQKEEEEASCNPNFPVSWMVWRRNEGKYRAGGWKPGSVTLYRSPSEGSLSSQLPAPSPWQSSPSRRFCNRVNGRSLVTLSPTGPVAPSLCSD